MSADRAFIAGALPAGKLSMPRLALLALLMIALAACASSSSRGGFAVGCQGSETSCRSTADHTGSGGANGGISGGANGGISGGANGGGMDHSAM